MSDTLISEVDMWVKFNNADFGNFDLLQSIKKCLMFIKNNENVILIRKYLNKWHSLKFILCKVLYSGF